MRLVFSAVALLMLTACTAGGRTPSSGCAKPQHDPFDPRSVVHILPGAVPPPYLTNPPTSGEHQPVNILAYRGLVQSPITPQIQVALLESSQVLIQYQPTVGSQLLASLESTPLVTLAPNPALPTPIVATAWLWRLRCAGPAQTALPSLRAFVAAHAGNGPQPPPPSPS